MINFAWGSTGNNACRHFRIIGNILAKNRERVVACQRLLGL